MRKPTVIALVLLPALEIGGGCSEQPRAQPTPIEAEAPAVHRPRRTADQPEVLPASPEVRAPEGPAGAQLDPSEVEALLEEATRLEGEGRDTVATVRLRKCANRSPGDARCDGRLGVLLSRSPQHRAESIYLLERAVALAQATTPPALYDEIGDALRRLTRYDMAAEALRLAIAQEETGARHAALAAALLGRPDGHDAAIEAFARAWELDKSQPEWLREQAALEAQRPGGGEAAIELLERYLEHTRGASEAHDRSIERRIDELRRSTGRAAATGKNRQTTSRGARTDPAQTP